MEKIILSLKTIYMMLMNEDFPIYSESVIGRNERKGQTMLRFWQRQIGEEFRSLPCGRMIWRNDGRRNRYTSYLCNRSAEIKTYSEYARELASQVSAGALLNQIGRFSEFLSARKYRHDVLIRRVRELLRLTEADDPRLNSQIADQIRQTADWKPCGTQGELFQASYLLTLLMLYAATGEAMDDGVMAVLREEPYSIQSLWELFARPAEEEKQTSFLTVHSSLLQDSPLPQHRFFGREEELFNLTEAACAGRKCLITSIGGMGKTELMRQLIRRLREENMVDRIAVVPYVGDLTESFGRAFPDFQRQDPEGSFRSVLLRLEKESRHGSVALIIDDLTKGLDADPALEELRALPIGILITSRLGSLEGFEPLSLSSPRVGTGALIFRDNYGQPLDREDQQVLTEMLADEALCHPLTLRLMARAARYGGLTVRELREKLQKDDASLSWQEDGRRMHLRQAYRQLYSFQWIPRECQQLAELFTLLPRDSYSPEFLTQWFPETVEGDVQGKLEMLTQGGWLDRDSGGYSMHALIAQCLRRRVITEERVGPMLKAIEEELLRREYVNANEPGYGELCRLGDILLHVCGFLSRSVSRELVEAAAAAMCASQESVQGKRERIELLELLEKRCSDKDDQTELMLATAFAYNCSGGRALFEPIFRQQKARLTVTEGRFLAFCINAGDWLSHLGEFDLAREMMEEVITRGAVPYQKACAYYYMIVICNHSCEAEAALSWAEEGAAYLAGTPDCGKDIALRLLAMLSQLFVKFGRGESARAVLKQIEDQDLASDNPLDRSQYSFAAGMYEMKFGDLEKALAHTRVSMEIMEEYEGRGSSYLLHQGQIAGILREMKRFDEALEIYQELVTEAERLENPMLLNLYSTNISTVYLALERPEEALTHLETAMILARESGGLALGVAQWNQAQAFRMLGDTEQELPCLKEAVPLLAESYGPDHPSSVAARQRLEELNGKEE